jgi:hypothetical protein
MSTGMYKLQPAPAAISRLLACLQCPKGRDN